MIFCGYLHLDLGNEMNSFNVHVERHSNSMSKKAFKTSCDENLTEPWRLL